jgi:nitrite reductase/ring-hydroxylating ferredoxin subunit
MASEALMQFIDKQGTLDQLGNALQPAVNQAFQAAGENGRQVKNFLHGTWLGHPLHPVLTDVPIGAWTTALALDAMEAISGKKALGEGADAAIAVGLAGAVGAAVTGLTDWSAIDGRAKKIGLMHGLLNASATVLYATSLALRRGKNRRAGLGFSMLGYAVSAGAAYLGAQLVYGEQIGVDHTATEQKPNDFVAVMDENALEEDKLTKAEANGMAVLLIKHNGKIHALSHTCTHMGGPLSEGSFDGETVQCPWHASRFSINDGHVVDGPATFPEPCFDTRVRDGKIEVKVARR